MKRRWLIMLASISFFTGGCDYREICTPAELWFRLDWSDFPGEELPTGVTIYCYPRDGGMIYAYKSNEINLIKADMPPGTYDILAFNQVEEEFETLLFEGMDEYATAQVSIAETSRPYWGLIYDQPVMCRPEWFALADLPGFEVKEEMYYGNGTDMNYIDLKPRNMIYTGTARFRVYRSDKIYRGYGEISGMAGSLMLGGGKKVEPRCVQLFEDVAVRSGNDIRAGYVEATYHSFGPLRDDGDTCRAAPEDHYVHYRFFLVDEKTICNYLFEAGDRVTSSDSARTVYVELGYGSDIPQDPSRNADPDRPGILPDVVPAHSSGFDTDIKGWSDEIIINLE